MSETSKTSCVDNTINKKYMGIFSIPFWLRIVLNIVIPLGIFGIVFAIVKESISKDNDGMAFCLSLLCSLLSSIIILLVKREIEEKNTTSICGFIDSVDTGITNISCDLRQFKFLKTREHFIDKSIDTADKVISGLVSHLADDCYGICSVDSDECKDCIKFKKGECNGLLRKYLYETCMTLKKAIEEYKDGKFTLSTNIRVFHTIAIEHLKGYKGSNYSVFHYIGNKKQNKANYNNLDVHFFNTFLKRMTDGATAYYNRDEKDKFVIRWLLIGDYKLVVHNYDYIFYVANDMLKISDAVMDDLFEFYIISETKYTNDTSDDLTKLSKFVKDSVQQEPSIGIFGDYFMFIESLNKPDEHGIIYTNMHNKNHDKNSVSETLEFFNRAISYAMPKKFTELKESLYNDKLSEQEMAELKEVCQLDNYNIKLS